MRVADRPVPEIVLDAVPMLAHWPVRPVIAIEIKQSILLYDDGLLYDDTWVYDDAWRDATCAFSGCEIDTGQPDENDLYPAARCVVQLENKDGTWSGYNIDGTSTQFGPGQMLNVWAHNDSGDWWLFSGKISRWDQRADDTIEVEAFDAFSDLAQEIGTYTPGVTGEQPKTRLEAILAAAGEAEFLHRFAPGTVALTAQPTEAAPLDEMQTVTGSDGSVLLVDADGTIVSFDRAWPAGREDQAAIPVASDNVCTAPYIVWEALFSTNDQGLADRVVLENIAGTQATAGTPSGYTLAYSGQQWTLQEEGDALAALLLNDRNRRRMSLEEFDLYLNDPHQPDIWQAVDWRRLDQLRFLHDQRAVGGTLRIDVTTLITSLLHEITPNGWSMTVGTAKVHDYTAQIFYDTGLSYDTGEEYGF